MHVVMRGGVKHDAYATCSGKRRLLGSNLENELLVWADSAQNYL
jgi:hypothetical protein